MCVVRFFSFSFSFLLIYIDPPRSLEEPSKNFRTTRRDYVSHLRYASFSSFCLLTSGDDRTAGIASTTNARKTHKLSEHHFYFSFPFLLLSCSLYLSLSSGCFPSSRYPEDFLRDITVDRDNERCTWGGRVASVWSLRRSNRCLETTASRGAKCENETRRFVRATCSLSTNVAMIVPR